MTNDTFARRCTRLAIEAVQIALISPILLMAWIFCAAHSGWERLILWAYYGGDEALRDKEEWKWR